jgi:hypothetical protein
LIFNHKKEEGYKILTVDSNRYDARYWLEHFLSVDAFEDENLSLKILEILRTLPKCCFFLQKTKEEVMFMNRSVNYFAKTINLKKFLNEVLDNPDLIPEFKITK